MPVLGVGIIMANDDGSDGKEGEEEKPLGWLLFECTISTKLLIHSGSASIQQTGHGHGILIQATNIEEQDGHVLETGTPESNRYSVIV
jgi:hypothetical protein